MDSLLGFAGTAVAGRPPLRELAGARLVPGAALDRLRFPAPEVSAGGAATPLLAADRLDSASRLCSVMGALAGSAARLPSSSPLRRVR
jgi:hypothetical protein